MSNRGRPTKFTQKIADKICMLLMTPMSLRRICEEYDDIPSKTTVLNWLNDKKYNDFLVQYTHAREIQSDMRVDAIGDMADIARDMLTAMPTPLLDDDGNVLTTKAGKPVLIEPFDKNTASLLNVAVNAQEKAAKLEHPKRYNSAHLNHGDADGNPLETAGNVAIEEINARLDRIDGSDSDGK